MSEEKKYFEFIKLNNPTALTSWLNYAPLRHHSNILNILYMSLHCFVRRGILLSGEFGGTLSAPFKRKQSIAER